MSTVLDPVIILLLLAAALMHATWNALLKADSTDRLATFGVIMCAGTVIGLACVPFLPFPEPGAWGWMAASILIHLAYYYFLLRAYSFGDLSHTYPIARGLGPLLVALLSGRLLGEALRFQDIAGVLLLTLGIVALALPQRRRRAAGAAAPMREGHHGRATLFAVLTGITIAAYIFADGLGVRAAGDTFEHRIAYIAWLNVCEGPWLMVLALVLRREAVLRYLRRGWWRGAIGGAIATLGYGIAIWALSAGPMAHVAAVRETSVLFAALMGSVFLGEPFGLFRIAAAGVIVSGLVLMNGPAFW